MTLFMIYIQVIPIRYVYTIAKPVYKKRNTKKKFKHIMKSTQWKVDRCLYRAYNNGNGDLFEFFGRQIIKIGFLA